MARLPDELLVAPTVKAIYEYHEREDASETRRGYLGGSQIGEECARKLWYSFRWANESEFDGRMLRLFDRGDREEFQFVKELKAIGCEVHDVDGEGNQFAVSDHNGHFSGHMDGVLRGIPEAPKTWHLAEFKTHNDKSFKDVKNKGVEKSKPTHFAQMQVYMHLAEPKLKRALYLAVNKNTDDLYVERVRYDRGKAEALLTKAGEIITSTMPPDKISEDPDNFACLWCDCKSVCHGRAIMEPTCRSCTHSTPIMEHVRAGWSCEKFKHVLTPEEQAKGCRDHLFIPLTINGAEPVDAGEEWVEYERLDGTLFRNGAGGFSSKELHEHGLAPTGLSLVNAVKAEFDTEVTSVERA